VSAPPVRRPPPGPTADTSPTADHSPGADNRASVATAAAEPTGPPGPGPDHTGRPGAVLAVRLAATGVLAVLLAVAVTVSLAVGDRPIDPGVLVDALTDPIDGNVDHLVVWASRIPRTVGGLVVGAGMAVAGALIQAATRNPLADPGILGVNAGAAFCVAATVAVLGVTSLHLQLWAALVGALAATVIVLAIGAAGRAGTDPVRLTLAGVAFAAVMAGLTTALTLLNAHAFDAMRSWGAGSLSVRGLQGTLQCTPLIIAGIIAAAVAARSLNAVALGDDLARGLGVRIARTRVIAVIGVTLACGTATAIAGPIGFVGLMVPHVVRWFIGPNQGWIIGLSLLAGPVLMLTADVLARVVTPGGMPVGVVTAFLGAPVLIAMARSKAVSTL